MGKHKTFVDLTDEDRQFLEANDPDYFRRYGNYQYLMMEEYKYATGTSISEKNKAMIGRRDPNFYHRIYPVMHPEDPDRLNDETDPNYVAPFTTHKMTTDERLEALDRTGGNFVDDSIPSASS